MDDDLISVELLGHRKLLQDIEDLPEDIHAIILQKADQWVHMLYEAVISNMEERLKQKTGELLNSIDYEVDDEGSTIRGRVFSRGVEYAKIQEEGGTIAPHMIYPKNGKVLAFMAATGDKVVATKVSHPGGHIPATHYMRDARREISPKVTNGLYYYIVRKLRNKLRISSNG